VNPVVVLEDGGWKGALGKHHPTADDARRSLSRSLQPTAPELTIKLLLEPRNRDAEGTLILAVAEPWYDILRMIERDPDEIYAIDPFTWEEIIAGAYKRAGFDEVILTPRSGDMGRDVVATRNGIGSIRVFDQVKAYKPGHLVTANDVRAMVGVITGAANVSKGVVTTTSAFAPRIEQDAYLAPLIPYRLELKSRDELLPWLAELKR
jgi:restriction system protein